MFVRRMAVFCAIVIHLFISVLDSDGENIALEKETKQSSILTYNPEKFGPHFANDGHLGQDSTLGECAHTTFNDSYFWWTVDLNKTYDIDNVIIYGRTDCCKTLLADFDILMFNPSDATWDTYDRQLGKLCFRQSGVSPVILNVTCANNVNGRFLKVLKKKNKSKEDDCLTLCEVQVFGTESHPDMCPCACSNKEKLDYSEQSGFPQHTKQEWREILAPVLALREKELRINKTKLSATRRKKTSANDNRKSAQSLGIMGTVVLAVVIGVVILIDILTLGIGQQPVMPAPNRV